MKAGFFLLPAAVVPLTSCCSSGDGDAGRKNQLLLCVNGLGTPWLKREGRKLLVEHSGTRVPLALHVYFHHAFVYRNPLL